MNYRIFFSLLLLAGSLSISAQAASPERTVLLLSFDGTRADALNQKNASHFLRLAHGGWQGDLTPIFPSETFPNHATLITGGTAHQHGIASNKFIDPQRGSFAYSMDPSWILCKPLWATLEEQGIKTALVAWPSHGRGSWHGQQTTYYEPVPTTDIQKIIRFDDQKKFEKILTLLKLPAQKRPRFIFAWFPNIDTQGHAFGPNSLEVNKAIQQYDQLLGSFIAALNQLPEARNIDLLIVADHGMALVKTAISVPYLQQKLKSIGPATILESGSNARIYCTSKTTPEFLAALKKISTQTRAFDVYQGNKLPPTWQDNTIRNGQILLVAPPKYYFEPKGPETTLLLDTHKKSLGKHGYAPSCSDMKALLIAHGPDFPAGKKEVHYKMTEIAPLVLWLLGARAF